jgi:hypothetical protein
MENLRDYDDIRAERIVLHNVNRMQEGFILDYGMYRQAK